MLSGFLPLRMTVVQPFSAAIHAASTLAAMPPRPCSLLLAVFTMLSCTYRPLQHVGAVQDTYVLAT